jgi:hypothetical protein
MKQESLRKLEALLRETEHNTSLAHEINGTCKGNAAKRKQKNPRLDVTTDQLRLASVEAAVVHRYADAGDAFYDLAAKYFDQCVEWNEQLGAIDLTDPKNSANTEQYLLHHYAAFQKLIKDFALLVRSEIEKTSKIL